MITMVLKLLKALNSEIGPWQIAFAGALALVIGLTPLWSVHNLVILLLAFVLRVHLATFFMFWALFTGLAYLLDPWFHQIGLYWLTQASLNETWTTMYQQDFWQVMHFNHSKTLGSLIVTVLAFLPTALLFRLGIIRYRASMMPWLNKLKVMQVLKGSRFYQLYERVDG